MAEFDIHSTGGPSPISACPHCGKQTLGQVSGKGAFSGTPYTKFECLSCGYTKKIEASECFVATAVYGDKDAPRVRVLREFRDRYLVTHKSGKLLVGVYYTIGPHVSKFVLRYPTAKRLFRFVLDLITEHRMTEK